MALPKLKHPTMPLTIPSNKKKVKIRPFTVAEEKILLMASVSDNPDDMVDAIKQVINNCLISNDDIDVDSLPLFDIEYLFVKLRGYSVNNIIEFQIVDADDKQKYDIEIDVNDVEVQFDPEHHTKFSVSEEIGIIMRYPNIPTMRKISKLLDQDDQDENSSEVSMEILFSIFASCIEKVYDEDKVYIADTDFTEEEIDEFLNSVSSEGFDKITNFFRTMPVLSYEAKYMTTKGEEKKITLSGMQDFFP